MTPSQKERVLLIPISILFWSRLLFISLFSSNWVDEPNFSHKCEMSESGLQQNWTIDIWNIESSKINLRLTLQLIWIKSYVSERDWLDFTGVIQTWYLSIKSDTRFCSVYFFAIFNLLSFSFFIFCCCKVKYYNCLCDSIDSIEWILRNWQIPIASKQKCQNWCIKTYLEE